MFCSKCGKPVNDGSLFCTYCGSPMTDSIPQSVPIQSTGVAPVETTAETEAPAVAVMTAVQESIAEPAPAQPVADSENIGQPVLPVPEQVINPETNTALPAEKYYTFGHLALCLAAVALMAIVAGVFAGLYFSVR